MEYSHQKSAAIQGQFDHYIKICLRNEARNMSRVEHLRTEQEVLFSELPEHYITNLCATTHLAELTHTFQAMHYSVVVENDRLSEALCALSDEKRIIVLLHYYLDMSDLEISQIIHAQQDCVKKIRQRALHYLKRNMEKNCNEE